MSIGKRIKELRKDILKLNQTDFGAPLGLTYSAIGGYEKEIRNVSDQSILAICREYGVSEQWLRTGEGPVFMEAGTFSLGEFAKQHNATELELNILKTYFELDPGLRNDLVQHFKDRLSASHRVSVADAEESYKKMISNSAQSMGSSALNTTEGTEQNAKEA